MLDVAAGPHPYIGATGIARAWAALFLLLLAVVALLHLVRADHHAWLPSAATCALLSLLITAYGHQRATRRR